MRMHKDMLTTPSTPGHGDVGQANGLLNITTTVAIPLHNHGLYIEELLDSLFLQWRPEYELLLIDDQSTDDGFEKVQAILGGHPEVRSVVMRTKVSEGMGLVHSILRFSKGQIIIRSDSDDLALDGRLEAIMACFHRDTDCRLVTSNATLISSDSRTFGVYNTRSRGGASRDLLGAADIIYDKCWLGATIAYHRDVYERFPPLDVELCSYGLDQLLPFRAMMLGSMHYIAEPLVGWRQHSNNTHRVHYIGDVSDTAEEKARALNMMVLAQRMRDAAFFAGQAPSPLLIEVLSRCRTRFDAEFDIWCRTRNRIMVRDKRSPEPAQVGYKPGMPPLPTLVAGETLRFSKGEFGAEILSYYTGFHQSEHWGTWTERLAHLSLRVVTLPASAIRLNLRLLAPKQIPHQRVRIRVGTDGWKEAEIGSEQPCDVQLSCAAVCETRVIDIILLVPGSVVLSKTDPSQTEGRVIGLGLVSISAVRDSPSPAEASRAVGAVGRGDHLEIEGDLDP